MSQKPNRCALCSVCAPTDLLTRKACRRFGILYCLITGKTDKEDSPVHLGRLAKEARKKEEKKKRTSSLMRGGPDAPGNSRVPHREGNVIFLGYPM